MRSLLLALVATAGMVGAEPNVQPDATTPTADAVPGFVEGLYHVMDLDLPTTPDAPFDVAIRFEDVQQVHLERHSYRSASFQVLADRGNGVMEPVAVPAPRTVKGTTSEGGFVAGSLFDDGLTAQVTFVDADEAWYIQPLSTFVEDAPAGRHIVYRREAAEAPPAWCGGGLDAGIDPVDVASNSRALYLCEIAFDADYEFYNLNQSSEANTVADIENVMAGVEEAYERDCGIIYEIGTIIVRTTSNDPYTSNNPETLLGQFQSHWNANQQGVHRDIAHLMTGRNIQGGVIGIAYLRGICNRNSGYGLSQSRFTGNYNSRVALTAHELGHNWGAGHCDNQGSSNCDIMCSGLGGCGGYGAPEFEDPSIVAITEWAARSSCLDTVPGGNLDLPFSDTFPEATLDLDLWQDVQGATVSSAADGEPSQPFAMNLDSNDTATTGPVRAADLIGQQVFAQYWVASTGVESGESLAFEYMTSGGSWVPLLTRTSDGNDMPFEFVSTLLPLQALYDGVQFRLRSTGNEGNDDWYVDNVYIGLFAGAQVPLTDDFEGGSLDPQKWAGTTGRLTSDAQNEPSGTMSYEISGTDRLESVNILAGSFIGTPLYVSFSTQDLNVEANESLIVDYRTSGGSYSNLGVILGDGIDQSSWDFHQFTLPLLAYHDDLTVRFTGFGQADDLWFIDDVAVTTEFIEDCAPDVNGDTVLDIFDILDFLALFDSQDDAADWNGDTVYDIFDVLGYLADFDAGC